jgi:hypothetical protein
VRRCVPLAAAGAAAATLALAAGCGGGDDPPAFATPRAPGRFLTRAELAAQLGDGFRRRLYHLAVMSQPDDDAADLGQPLPTGTLRSVSCRPARARPTAPGGWPWSCGVHWKSTDGRRELTRYSASLDARGCFFASARPQLPQRFDATIGTYSEHPLNALQSLRRGC